MTGPWQPRVLREYSFIAVGERGAVIAPTDDWHVWGGYYEPGSLIWRNRWVGASVMACREALAMPAPPGGGLERAGGPDHGQHDGRGPPLRAVAARSR